MKNLLGLLLGIFFLETTHAKSVFVSGSDIDELLEIAHTAVGFNGNLLIGDSDGVLFYRQLGFADKEKLTPLTDKHLFSTGSIGKEFSTLAIMKLAEQGKLNYQDKVSKYVNRLPEWSKDISIEHIMAHTSGLPSLNWFVGIESVDVDNQIAAVKKLAFKPGSGFLYTNMNIVLRSYIVEAITSQPYQDFIYALIFAPANMATAKQPIGMKNLSAMTTFHEDPNALKAISSYGTPLDLYQFELALWNDKIIDSKAIEQVLGGDTLSGSKNRSYFDFGRFYFNETGTLSYWEHDGSSWPSHHALKYHNFDKDLIITAMSNDGNKSILFELRESVLKSIDLGKAYIPQSWLFKDTHKKQGFKTAFEQLVNEETKSLDKELYESQVNQVGYWLFQNKELQQARAVFRHNLLQFPESANVYDSFAEVLIELGETKLAKSILNEGIRLAEGKDQSLVNSLNKQLTKLEQQ